MTNKLFRIYRKTLNMRLDDIQKTTGINVGYISRWERGLIEISNDVLLQKLEKYFKLMEKRVVKK